MSEERNSPGTAPAPSGAERREYFRVNTELRLSLQPQEVGGRRPWAYADDESISPLIGPRDEELRDAYQRLRGQRQRQTNLSAGGLRAGYRVGEAGDQVPEAVHGEALSVLIELSFPGEPEYTLVHVPAWVVWVDQTMKWKYMGCQFARIPTGIERIVSQFVMEVERRRLRPT